MSCATERAHHYVYGLLDEPEAAETRDHLERCGTCRDLVEGYRRELGFWERALRLPMAGKSAEMPRTRPWVSRVPVAAAMVPLAALVVYLLAPQPSGRDPAGDAAVRKPREVPSSIRVLAADGKLNGKPAESATYAFSLSLDPLRKGELFSVHQEKLRDIRADKLKDFDLLVLGGLRNLTPDQVAGIERFVREGGGLLIALGPELDKTSYNDLLWKDGNGVSPARVEEIAGQAPGPNRERGVERRLDKVVLDHPVFRPFRGRLEAALKSLTFHKYWRARGADSSCVPAVFDDESGSPAFVEKKFGLGRTLLFTSTLDGEWNEGIPAHPPYLILMRGIAEHLTQALRSRGLLACRRGDGLEVRRLEPDDPLARAGLRRGDLMLASDGKPLEADTDLRQAKILRIRRGDQALDLKLEPP